VRNLLTLLLMVSGTLGVLVPGFYFNATSDLPSPLESRHQLLTLMRMQVEGERMKRALPMQERERGFVKWPEPDIGRFPRDFVALYLSEMGCPTFLRAPPEPRMAWLGRVLQGTWGSGLENGQAGRCAYLFASRLVDHLDVTGRLERAIAIHRIRNLLSHEELVAWDMASTQLDDGMLGLDQGVEAVYGRPLAQLGLSELAEAVLMAPPNNAYGTLRICQNPPLIKRARDAVLAQLLEYGLTTEAQASAGQQAEVACHSKKN